MQSCVDCPGELVPVDTLLSRGRLDRRGPAPPAPWSGDDPVMCTVQPRGPGPLLDDEVCIPGGAFLLGDTLALTDLEHCTRPERVRVVAPFLLDVHEMTVGRFREAIRRGLVPLTGEQGVFRNDGPLTPQNACTWNEGATPDVPAAGIDRESFPLNCVAWEQARAVCRFFGGDLPAEDQWEYAATAAGRPRETQYPWGDELVTCEHAVVQRAAAPPSNRRAPAFGPTAVNDPSWTLRDVTPPGRDRHGRQRRGVARDRLLSVRARRVGARGAARTDARVGRCGGAAARGARGRMGGVRAVRDRFFATLVPRDGALQQRGLPLREAGPMSARLWGLAFLCAFGGCVEPLPPRGQILLYVDTDAPVPAPRGAPFDPGRLSPLVDRARFEVLVDGAVLPGSSRDFALDDEEGGLVDRRRGPASAEHAYARDGPGLPDASLGARHQSSSCPTRR